MTKAARQAKILEAVRSGRVRTQEDLAVLLGEQGITASQVTMSRDLRELGVVKSSDGYREPGAAAAVVPQEQLARALREFRVDCRSAQNVVVIKTRPGAASPLGLALDRVGWEEIVGTVAGDDTIFVATPSESEARELVVRLNRLG
jgi:transcriptional regulator of arginine metabolism